MKIKKNDIKQLPIILKNAASQKPKQAIYSRERPTNESFTHIKNIDDFLQDINLQEKFKSIFRFGYGLDENHIYKDATEERNYEAILLLERLEVVYVEWDKFDNQNHREVGNRLITFSYYGDMALEMLNRIKGKNSIITKRTLQIIAQHAKDMDLGDYLIELLFSSGVPESLIDYEISGDDAGVTYRSLLYFASSKKKADHKILFNIIEKLSSRYVCGGDEKALEIQDKFGNLLKKNGYTFYNGKIESLKELHTHPECIEIENTSIIKKYSPQTLIEKGIGYFKFRKQEEKIQIGEMNSRKFRLLQFLSSPIDSGKTIDSVFDAIKLPRDKDDQMLNGYNTYQSIARKIELIGYTIKELQKNKELQGRLKFELDHNQRTYRLRIT